MKIDRVLLDTGPLVAYFDQNERFHEWAVEQFARLDSPAWTCEPVLTEAFHLLRRFPTSQMKLLEFVETNVISIRFCLADETVKVKALWEHYRNVPISLADACLIRMAELFDRLPICTLDSDFRIYRKNGRQMIPLILPPTV